MFTHSWPFTMTLKNLPWDVSKGFPCANHVSGSHTSTCLSSNRIIQGGYSIFSDIFESSSDNCSCGLQAMVCAFYFEKVDDNQNFLNLHELFMKKRKHHLCDFLKQNFLHLQMKVVSETCSYLINLCRMWALENNMYYVPNGQEQSGLQYQRELKWDANNEVGYSLSH